MQFTVKTRIPLFCRALSHNRWYNRRSLIPGKGREDYCDAGSFYHNTDWLVVFFYGVSTISQSFNADLYIKQISLVKV